MADLTANEVRALLDSMARGLGKPRNGHGGQKQLAAKLGVSQSFLSDVLNGNREPSGPLVEAMGLVRVVTYRKVGGAGVGTSNGGTQ